MFKIILIIYTSFARFFKDFIEQFETQISNIDKKSLILSPFYALKLRK